MKSKNVAIDCTDWDWDIDLEPLRPSIKEAMETGIEALFYTDNPNLAPYLHIDAEYGERSWKEDETILGFGIMFPEVNENDEVLRFDLREEVLKWVNERRDYDERDPEQTRRVHAFTAALRALADEADRAVE